MTPLLACFLEEPSAKAFLESLLPRLGLGDAEFQYVVFEGKSDLEKNIVRKLRAWRYPETRFLILRDQDSADCRLVKQGLMEKVYESGPQRHVCIRIACRELESFFLGDLDAVERGLSIPNLSRHKGKAKFRNPDDLTNAAQELEKLSGETYQKISGARQITPLLALNGTNRSTSFCHLVAGIHQLFDSKGKPTEY